jgi:hypothetical protein
MVVARTSMNNIFFPKNSNFAKMYPAITLVKTDTIVEIRTMYIELNIYLRKSACCISDMKFLNVGFFGYISGGILIISDRVINEPEIIQ